MATCLGASQGPSGLRGLHRGCGLRGTPGHPPWAQTGQGQGATNHGQCHHEPLCFCEPQLCPESLSMLNTLASQTPPASEKPQDLGQERGCYG